MRIYHYTSIETLALILKNKTIRFNRLDKVDDLEESEYGLSHVNIKMGQYHFVSCWTKDSIENIALWGLYTKYKGVRISLDEDMFVSYPLNQSLNCYFPGFLTIGKDYIINAPNNEVKLIDVIYVDDLKSKNIEIGKYNENKEENTFSIEYSNEYGNFKSKQWEFQKESRFKISVQPIKIPKQLQSKNSNIDMEAIMNSIAPALIENKPISVNHFDIMLKEDTFLNMEILLAPQTTDSERIIVESLINSFCPKAKLADSIFKGKIRYKGTF